MLDSTLQVSHAQISVFDSTLANPFNNWNDLHVEQGFSWRPGSVSFRTLETDGPIHVHVTETLPFELMNNVVRAIVVPFTIPDHCHVEVATIVNSARIKLHPGLHSLTFAHWISDGMMRSIFHFERKDIEIEPRVLRADPELRVPHELLMVAEPA